MVDTLTCCHCHRVNNIDDVVLLPDGKVFCCYCGHEMVKQGDDYSKVLVKNMNKYT